jgi:DNA polymerase III subunit gamma/tau
MELDAASNRSVDEMTQVLETAVYAPSMGRYKVYVIDEVHMLSNHAFNAMLKTLEEPPAHVLFVLATTDPQKVPVTVLSRCLQLGLKNMTASAISGHLAEILDKESIVFDEPALAWIGKAARGSMRDALSLTDQAITYASGKVLDAPTREMLGIVPGDQVLAIFDALSEGDAALLLSIADQMLAQAASFQQALMQIAERCQALGWVQKGVSLPDQDSQLALDASRFDALDIQVLYQIAIHGARDLGLAPDPYTGFTMSLLRLLAFTAGSIAPSADLPKRPAAQPLTMTPVSKVARVTPPASSARPSVAPAVPVILSVPSAGFDGDWPSLAASLMLTGVPRMFAQQSQLLNHRLDEHGLALHLRVGVKLLADPAHIAKVKDALHEKLGCAVRLKVDLGEVAGDTAESLSRQAQNEKIAQTQASLESLTMVRSLMDHLDGKIVPGSVKPSS